MNKKIVNKIFPDATRDIENHICPTCGRKIKVGQFRDQLSVKEYRISGMCQVCQDEVFN